MNIAILEDESIHIYRLTEIISSLLKNLGVSSYELKTFKDKKALLAELFIPSNQNVYFLDLELQGDQQQGLKVGQQIRDYDSQAALIFFTSHAELMPLTYKYKVAALDFIAKDSLTILDSIKEDFKLVLNKRQKNHLRCSRYKWAIILSILNLRRSAFLRPTIQIVTLLSCG